MAVSARLLVVSSCLALLSACGGGYKAMAPASAPTPAASQTVVAGTVTGTAASLQMGGQPLDATSATVTVNGQPGTTADLQPGVILHGRGDRSGSVLHLHSADVRPDFCGPVTAVDGAGGKLTLLGTTVTVDALTVLVQEAPGHTFTPLSLADFKVGDVARVFGALQADGSFLATRIERRMPRVIPEMLELRGVVSALDATASTFILGSIAVTYDKAKVHGTLANGVSVEVGGSLTGTAFTATWVEVEHDADDDSGAPVEARGALTALDLTAKTFTLLSFKVDFSSAVVHGTLVEGAVIEVEGSFSSSTPNTILATQVQVRFGRHGHGGSDAEARGSLTALNATDLTLVLNGATYWTDAQTVFIRGDAAATFADLKVGDMVEVRALTTQTNAAGQPYASRVEVEGMH